MAITLVLLENRKHTSFAPFKFSSICGLRSPDYPTNVFREQPNRTKSHQNEFRPNEFTLERKTNRSNSTKTKAVKFVQ